MNTIPMESQGDGIVAMIEGALSVGAVAEATKILSENYESIAAQSPHVVRMIGHQIAEINLKRDVELYIKEKKTHTELVNDARRVLGLVLV